MLYEIMWFVGTMGSRAYMTILVFFLDMSEQQNEMSLSEIF